MHIEVKCYTRIWLDSYIQSNNNGASDWLKSTPSDKGSVHLIELCILSSCNWFTLLSVVFMVTHMQPLCMPLLTHHSTTPRLWALSMSAKKNNRAFIFLSLQPDKWVRTENILSWNVWEEFCSLQTLYPDTLYWNKLKQIHFAGIRHKSRFALRYG